MDFVSDTLSSGRQFRCLTIVDEHTRESLAIHVSHSIPAVGVIEVLERLGTERGLPRVIVTDNGSEFTSRAFDAWAYARGVKIDFIQPGKPVQNCFIESFNGTFRDDCLNLHWFMSLPDARRTIETWRNDYNHARPYSSLGNVFTERGAPRQNQELETPAIRGSTLGVSSVEYAIFASSASDLSGGDPLLGGGHDTKRKSKESLDRRGRQPLQDHGADLPPSER